MTKINNNNNNIPIYIYNRILQNLLDEIFTFWEYKKNLSYILAECYLLRIPNSSLKTIFSWIILQIGGFTFCSSTYIYIYMYIYMCMGVYIYIYIYIQINTNVNFPVCSKWRGAVQIKNKPTPLSQITRPKGRQLTCICPAHRLRSAPRRWRMEFPPFGIEAETWHLEDPRLSVRSRVAWFGFQFQRDPSSGTKLPPKHDPSPRRESCEFAPIQLKWRRRRR